MGWRRWCAGRIALFVAMILGAAGADAYSILTHEELIDLAWNDSIRSLLQARFPGATEEQLREAHAYAYGASALQDGLLSIWQKIIQQPDALCTYGRFHCVAFRECANHG